jgi:hypothetical protein
VFEELEAKVRTGRGFCGIDRKERPAGILVGLEDCVIEILLSKISGKVKLATALSRRYWDSYKWSSSFDLASVIVGLNAD